MDASYKLALKQQQRRLNLSYKQLNKLDRKYNDINLIKYLMALNVGFFGTFAITNTPGGLLTPINLQAKLAYNNLDITSYVTIASGTTQTISVPIGSRLPSPSLLLQLKIIIGAGVIGIDSHVFTGFTPISLTDNTLTEENTFDLLVNSNQIDNGNLTLTLIVES